MQEKKNPHITGLCTSTFSYPPSCISLQLRRLQHKGILFPPIAAFPFLSILPLESLPPMLILNLLLWLAAAAAPTVHSASEACCFRSEPAGKVLSNPGLPFCATNKGAWVCGLIGTATRAYNAHLAFALFGDDAYAMSTAAHRYYIHDEDRAFGNYPSVFLSAEGNMPRYDPDEPAEGWRVLGVTKASPDETSGKA